ncbi:hypothetical protein, partial [Micromonospora sp. Rc5]|uniref:hypothetical protein n=1 Tax=Micromonospora sp. Rc5 TaxID=1920666 RepID=UPI001304031B
LPRPATSASRIFAYRGRAPASFARRSFARSCSSGAQLIPFGTRSWSLAWSGPEVEWDAGAADRETMRSSFRAGGTA